MRRTILFDTNFLLIPQQFHIDIFAEVERICPFPYGLAVLAETVRELEHIQASQKGKDAKAAAIALALIKAKDLKTISPLQKGGEVDDLLVGLAGGGVIVATQDKALKARILAKGAPVIILRNKKHLELVNHVL